MGAGLVLSAVAAAVSSAAAQELEWATAGGTSQGTGEGIATDSRGNSYVTGWFGFRATFGAGEANETVLRAAGIEDIFVAKYDRNNRLLWPNHLICLVCGKPQKVLKRHLAVQHDLTPAEYRERFGLKPDYPMTAPNDVQQRREIALRTGLGTPKKPARRGRRTRDQKPPNTGSGGATTGTSH
jgi:hypothetical protein